MKIRDSLQAVLLGIVMMAGQGVIAQTREVSVAFLRAALGSLPDRSTVTVEAIYLPDPGLMEATGRYLRTRGYSRFSVRDVRSNGVFTSLYCDQNGKAFRDLVGILEPKRVRLSGYRDNGENNEAALMVTGVEVLPEPVRQMAATQDKESGTFRVTIKDVASSTKTILANVSTGRTYTVEGMTLLIEPEKEAEAGAETSPASPSGVIGY